MTKIDEIEETLWGPGGTLGKSKEHTRKAGKELQQNLEAFREKQRKNLTAISLRLPEEVISALKAEADAKGIGYQTLARILLTEHSKKRA